MSTHSRPLYMDAQGRVTDEWARRYGFIVRDPNGALVHFSAFKRDERATYIPTPKQLDFHESLRPNCIIEGSRGTGKSGCIRMDAHMRALSCPNYTYLIVRRTMPELKKSHLRYVQAEMHALAGRYHSTDAIAYYPNGSQGFFGHCQTEEDMLKLLSSQYDAIYFDEISTFTWTMITKIASCTRVEEGSGKMDVIRGGTNPIGVGASDVKHHFIDKDVSPEEDPDYDPDEWEAVHTTMDDNPHIDRARYIRRLSSLPAHIRRAWLDGEWVIEGAYFHDYLPSKGDKPWHVVDEFPVITPQRGQPDAPHRLSWIQIYRAFDWGFSPDPAVCLWIPVLPNGRAFILKEKHWHSTTAREVARSICEESQGMHIVDTFCDPTIFFGEQATEHESIGNIIEAAGVSLTPSINDRAAAGFAIHEYLNTVLDDGLPKLQIYGPACPMLVRTLPEMRTHPSDPRKIANGNDHWVIALAYFCMGATGTSREPRVSHKPRWMRPNPKHHRQTDLRLGLESVQRRLAATHHKGV